MIQFHRIATAICATCSAAIVIAATTPAHSAAQGRSAEPAIARAMTYCADRMIRPAYDYAYRARTMSLSEDRSVLCFDGTLMHDLDLSPFHQMRDYFKGRVAYESYPESQEAVDRILRPFWLYIRAIYDPPDDLLAAR